MLREHQILARTTHPLPLWLATLLAVQRLGPNQQNKTICTLELPEIVAGARELSALKADPRVVDLRSWSRWYWGLVNRCLELWEDEEVGDVGGDAFKIRAAEIADYAHNPRGAPAEFVQRLDETEMGLFKSARDSSRAVREWLGEVKRKG